jgi:hypothetical protein
MRIDLRKSGFLLENFYFSYLALAKTIYNFGLFFLFPFFFGNFYSGYEGINSFVFDYFALFLTTFVALIDCSKIY